MWNWKKRGTFVRAAAMAMCLFFALPLGVSAETLADIQQEQQRLESEKQELQSKLDELKNDEAEKEAYQQTLDEQIEVVQQQIDSARTSIETLNKSIDELSANIEKSEQDIEDTMNQFKERVKAIYKAGEVSTLEILLNSESLNDFSMRSELLQSMSRRDQQLVEKLTDYMNETKDEREECEKQKQEVAELKKTLESKNEELAGLVEENQAALAELETAQENTLAAIAENEAQGQAAISRAEELIAQQKAAEEEARRQAALQQQENGGGDSSSGSSGGGYVPSGGGGVEGFNPIWPLPGVSYISCHYGDGGHRGLDIAGPYGTAIVAAESGQVLVANNYDSWGDSWGYYVLIYHNGTYTTRYAHMSSMIVSDGQYVEKGQIIGYEGSTGNSTGPHLHFEVYENGVRVNPSNFL